MTDRQRHGLVLLLVAGLIAASAVVIVSMKTVLGLDLKGGVELVYKATPTEQARDVTPYLQQAVDVMDKRVNQLGVSEPSIQTQGRDQIVVQLPNVKNVAEAERDVGTTARLEFYDWEANALVVPAGSKTTRAQSVASLLVGGDTNARTVSQGSTYGTNAEPGGSSPLAGAMGFYAAVKLASQQPGSDAGNPSRLGPEYFLFGAPGSTACAAAAAAKGHAVQKGVHCLIAGPYQAYSASTTRAQAISQLESGLSNAETTGTEVLIVPQGITVLQAVPASFSNVPTYGSPTTGYYVLKDNVALFGSDITNPEASTDNGEPDVQFGFTSKGNTAFSRVTAQIASRGQSLSIGSQSLIQHFAAALDNQLLTVPQIDYKQYPNGISGGGADITGNFTTDTAQSLATQLRLGTLPINLTPISQSQVSATLGQQALHQGLIAGIIGLAVVIVFLIAFYRLLGVIAVGGLIVYGIYFYALIKLIPITLTLAGIAGLILTIGVAADANIVIFERVKEEIRAGRSIRQGIAIGYKKGLTAIIDANVVTIMTAFILFVLATQDVKGFAFTLGIGTFVSLFTAVLATQAILMTMGSSRAINSPAVLGANGQKRRWNYDFMGASRWFFTLSGTILLIGALAIGGRGLNLGIDFTSGSQISFGLEHPATTNEVRSLLGAVGAGDAQVQKITGSKTLGPYAFQVDSKYLGTFPSGANKGESKVQYLSSQLQQRYGLRTNAAGSQDFNNTSVGPTFGSTVAHSAIVAIIISLIVISLYVTLRFDWKFAVPVLIALAHDLLITAGVYALTGRVVTTDTVAALLTILGYSMYDTIIVFDRVRENIPRMPRAAFSQIVNRSMSEVITRSLATTSVTLLPIIALLVLGGSTLKDFAFALLVGVASGAYSSIFIASPVLTHWKEREHSYAQRRARIVGELGYVPAYADGRDADTDPVSGRPRRTGRLTAPEPDNVSAREFEQMKRDLGLEDDTPARATGTLTQRLAHSEATEAAQARPGRPASARPAPAPPRPASPPAGAPDPAGSANDPAGSAAEPTGADEPFEHAPDEPEAGGMTPSQKPKGGGARRSRNRRHGRR